MKKKITIGAALLFSSTALHAATFVYVSNPEDGDISQFTLQADGSLKGGARFKAEKIVMPMSVSPDKRFLAAAVRSTPFKVYSSAPRLSPRACRTSSTTAPGNSCSAPRTRGTW